MANPNLKEQCNSLIYHGVDFTICALKEKPHCSSELVNGRPAEIFHSGYGLAREDIFCFTCFKKFQTNILCSCSLC